MDQLDLLKKDWKKQDASLPKLSFDELSKLIHKRSSSIVKWIFIISLLEFIIPNSIVLITGYEPSENLNKDLELTNFMNGIYIITSIVILYFIYRFYKNYKLISANSNSKELMQNIIKTRKTVKHYIWFNLAMVPIIASVILYKTFNSSEFLEKLPEGTSMVLIWFISILSIIVAVFIVWLFYRLLYGILLNKLKHNYNELISTNGE